MPVGLLNLFYHRIELTWKTFYFISTLYPDFKPFLVVTLCHTSNCLFKLDNWPSDISWKFIAEKNGTNKNYTKWTQDGHRRIVQRHNGSFFKSVQFQLFMQGDFLCQVNKFFLYIFNLNPLFNNCRRISAWLDQRYKNQRWFDQSIGQAGNLTNEPSLFRKKPDHLGYVRIDFLP